MTAGPRWRLGWLAVGTAIVVMVGVALGGVITSESLRAVFGTRTLTVLIHQGVEGVALKRVIAEYAGTSHVAVNVMELPYDQLYQAALDPAGPPGRAFDVVMLDDPWLPALTAAQVLREIALDPGQCETWQPRDFPESVLRVASGSPQDDGMRNTGGCSPYGPLYALPFVGNSQLFCRRDPAAPRDTWAQVMAAGRGDDGRAAARYVMRVGPGNPIVTDFMPVLWTFSPSSLAADPLRLAPDALPALRLLEQFGREPNADLTVLSYDDFDLAVYLARREASMTIMWSAWAMAMARLPPEFRSTVLGCGALPRSGDGGPAAGAPALGAWLLGVAAGIAEEQHQEAVRFLLFATSPQQLEMAAWAGNPPPRISVLRSAGLAERYPTFPAQLSSLTAARARPRTPHWRSAERTLGACLSALYEGAIDAPAALARTNAALALLPAEPGPGHFSCRNPAGAAAATP